MQRDRVLHFISLALVWMMASCAAYSAEEAGLSESDPAPNESQVPVMQDDQAEMAWSRHGFTAPQRDRIHAALQRGVEQKFIPGGALLIIHRGEPVFREALGYASLESGTPFALDAPCRIASLTKPHTSTLFAMLVEQGKLTWDDSVDKYLPDFAGVTVRGIGPATRSIKIRELLSHTAGFPGQAAIDAGQWRIKQDGALADVVADLPRQGLATEPGTGGKRGVP